MRRLARHLFALCSAVSLVLCVASAVLWARTRWFHPFALAVAPANGRYVSVWQGTYSHELEIASVAPWPHPGFVLATLDGEIPFRLMPSPAPTSGGREWAACGIRFMRDYGVSDGVSRLTHDGQTDVVNWPPSPSAVAYWHLTVPCWMAVASFACPPALWLGTLAVRRCRRSGRGRKLERLCPSCGYDLRASPERCPECGLTSPAKVTT